MTTLTGVHGNIGGKAKVKKVRRRMRKRRDQVIVLTEAYKARPYLRKWARKFGYTLHHPTRKRYGAEGPDVAMLVRNDVRVVGRTVARMHEPWVGPLRLLRKQPRVVQTLHLRTPDGARFDVTGAHLPSGGPSGGRITRGRNAAAWREMAGYLRDRLRASDCGAVVGDLNASGPDARKWIAPPGARVRMGSGVDGVVIDGCSVTLRRLKNPRGQHGWFAFTLRKA